MMAIAALDPITQEILASGFHHIAEEMAVVEYRSSYSPIIREMLDFNCGLFTADGRMVANSEQIPAQLGLMQFALQSVIDKWGDDIAEGDAFLTNHPYMGGTHTPDLQVFTPLLREGRIVAWAGSIAHHIDIGGRFPGTESAQCTELFQEGLIFPALKLVERRTRVRSLYDLIAANVRDPASTLGDLDAQLAACRRGMSRIEELAGVHGLDTVLAGMEALLAGTARRAEAAFRAWPDRTVSAEGFLDDEGFEGTSQVRVHVTVHVEDGELVVDLTGSSEQIPSGMNVPISSAHAGTYFAVRAFLGPDVPQNAGLTSRVRVIAPEGTVFNPRFPAALSARHLAVQRLTDVLIEALGELLPDRAVAASHVSFPALVFQAVDPRSGRLTLLADILGGGGGARRDAPGDDGIDPYCSNCAILPAEIAELEYPWRIERTELVEGSGGNGAMRGGLSLRRDYRLLADTSDGMYYVEQTLPEFAAKGRNGGGPGAPGSVSVLRAGSDQPEQLPGKGYIHLYSGDVLTLVGAGGGGFGPVSAERPKAPNDNAKEMQ
jgi:N-methylhydantoinase B